MPLDQLIDSHNLNGNAVTVLYKEVDLTQKSKIPVQKGETDTYDIIGLADWNGQKINDQFSGNGYQV